VTVDGELTGSHRQSHGPTARSGNGEVVFKPPAFDDVRAAARSKRSLGSLHGAGALLCLLRDDHLGPRLNLEHYRQLAAPKFQGSPLRQDLAGAVKESCFTIYLPARQSIRL